MKKVLLVSYHFPPLNSPGTQHPTWFFRFLREYGFETTVLASSTYFGEAVGAPTIIDPHVIREPQGSLAKKIYYNLNHAELWAQLRFDTWDPGFVWGALHGVPTATKLLKQDRFDAIVSCSPSIASHWAALRIKQRFKHLRWIADFQDPFLGNPFRRNGAEMGLERALERAIFSHADCLSANTDTVRAMWQERYPEYRDKMVISWGGYDPEESVGPLPVASQGAPVLKYVGAIYGMRNADAVLLSLQRLAAQGRLRPSDLVADFLGAFKFGRMDPVVADLERQGFVQVRRNYVPREQALTDAASAHYSLLLDVSGANNTVLQVPAKLFDQIRIGRPILAFTPPQSPTERILAKSGIPHISVSPTAPPDEVDTAILRLLQIPPLAHAPSQWFQDTFDARRIAGVIAAGIRGEGDPLRGGELPSGA